MKRSTFSQFRGTNRLNTSQRVGSSLMMSGLSNSTNDSSKNSLSSSAEEEREGKEELDNSIPFNPDEEEKLACQEMYQQIVEGWKSTTEFRRPDVLFAWSEKELFLVMSDNKPVLVLLNSEGNLMKASRDHSTMVDIWGVKRYDIQRSRVGIISCRKPIPLASFGQQYLKPIYWAKVTRGKKK